MIPTRTELTVAYKIRPPLDLTHAHCIIHPTWRMPQNVIVLVGTNGEAGGPYGEPYKVKIDADQWVEKIVMYNRAPPDDYCWFITLYGQKILLRHSDVRDIQSTFEREATHGS